MIEKLKRLEEVQCYNSFPFEPCNICNSFNVVMRSKPVSRQRGVYPRLATRLSRDAHCKASVRLLVIREGLVRRSHQKCFSVSGSKLRRPRHKTDDLVLRSPRDAFSRQNQRSLSRPAA